MSCPETKNLLNAYVDGELDSGGSLSVENHLQRCDSCLTEVQHLRALATAIESGGLRFKAPQRLKRNVKTAIRAANSGKSSSFWGWRWTTAFASAVVVVILGWTAITHWTRSSEEGLLVNDIVSSHIRSMMANHITDVVSSDSHTVKPWFGGKLDYSPPTKDLAEQGFPLTGGRLDYFNGRPVAALVYRRNQHFINLFVWPSNKTDIQQKEQLTRQGYNVIHWAQEGMTYWLVSDLNLTELNECARLLKE